MYPKAVAIFAALPFLVAATGLEAAPQILGLVASAKPVPLTCAGGTCSAEISAVCLQQQRDVPEPGTAYTPAKGTEITVTATGPDSLRRSLAIAHRVTMRSVRSFTSVLVRLPEAALRDAGLNIETAALSVGPLASAVPVAAAGDTNPLSRREIERYTGALRPLADGAMHGDRASLTATEYLNQMINRLPLSRHVGADRIEPVWNEVVAADAAAKQPETARLLTRAIKACRFKLRVESMPGLRACLGNQHDILMSDTTKKVWKALKPGG
ncbi:MAG: hypothetical protein QGH73_01325 [Rhodospirillales bacterium]|jgi:hypothetical protein|nr:hypothetical protein [Rhodospirillaceae bacterium]MDP6427799.1 hypothetical protein [Rhodospirillales bacterium]MDP6644567.1 hypothetical protein [Rhodospirillales bacterium]MDP6840299.1 hypothetical protein [Rhodospirillales bacterium]|tara:strand:- start:127 stop:933 length:807 start_codon:yes stop_codon:yes gene_type:complete